jgi:hypothetical protein
MDSELWTWQDEDAERLRRQGKGALADCWESFDLACRSLAESAELALLLPQLRSRDLDRRARAVGA